MDPTKSSPEIPSATLPPTAIAETPRPTPRQIELQRRIEDLRTQVEDYTRREPVKAILIALGAGLIVGRLIHMIGKSVARKREIRRDARREIEIRREYRNRVA